MPSAPRRFGSKSKAERVEQVKAYDHRRGSASERGYNGPWRKASTGHKRKHPLCRGCEAAGLIVAVDVTDHVVPGTSGTPEFWNSDRWQSACQWHHDVVKQRLEQLFAQGRIGIESLWLDSPFALALAEQLRRP